MGKHRQLLLICIILSEILSIILIGNSNISSALATGTAMGTLSNKQISAGIQEILQGINLIVQGKTSIGLEQLSKGEQIIRASLTTTRATPNSGISNNNNRTTAASSVLSPPSN